MIAVATVRKCRTVAKTETVGVRRYYREGCQPLRTPTERPLFVVGVPRIESNRPVRHTRKGILRVEILVPENIPGNIPDPENIP